ncbi:MAG: glycosyltransferase family 2 protein [Halobacteriota archaeon]
MDPEAAARTAKAASGDRVRDALSDGAEAGVRTSFVLPAFNEAENLPHVVDEIREVAATDAMVPYRPIEIIVVDDGSTDDTSSVLAEIVEAHPRVRGLVFTRNFGQSAALTAGFDAATGSYIVTLDADGQNNPADVPAMLARLDEGYDCVNGWRRDRRDPLSKTVPSRVQTALAKLTGPDINDFGCTLKAYRAEAVDALQLSGEGHRYIPAKLYDRGYRITEVPVDHRPREHGRSKYGTGRLLRGFVDLGYHVFWNRYGMRPMHFLGGLGLLTVAVGGVIGTHALVLKYTFGEALIPHLPRLLLVVALILFGLHLLTFGIIAEMLVEVRNRNRRPYRVARVIEAEAESP